METSLIQPIDPATLPDATGNYAHGTLVAGVRRAVFVSGQVPWAGQGAVPEDFDSQCRLTWHNVFAVLAEADMGVRNLAKVTTYLSDRMYREANSRIRQEILGDHRPALTVVIAGIYSEEWLLEIEAIAVE
ncbi:enamine deaminase RidA (YjgF/YER057c/UK114 family) [Thermocatellispora tengchongensis]|uniref:Enamine deaminase RidA (YjgF/YER057c/UK114 family) n=1 Tax=Thermocatellispora tengchongensis TaxID=1073253 RepID=A0A840NVA4_9ACTN|nr:RidA family protein [Thermocatellispora tengchongensis]MBB5130739.1 enamine deaminase RidA (YjgF/YER057c/UK114 family) [Thermocatellispora tengchongensis]